MENNKYTDCFLLRKVKGINMFFSLVPGEKIDSIEFTSRDMRKSNEKYYLVCDFANEFEDRGSRGNEDFQFIQKLGKKEEFVIKDVYAAAKKWLDEHCQIDKVSIKVVGNITRNKHLCFGSSKVFFRPNMTHDNSDLNDLFYYKKGGSYLCDDKGVMLVPKEYYPSCLYQPDSIMENIVKVTKDTQKNPSYLRFTSENKARSYVNKNLQRFCAKPNEIRSIVEKGLLAEEIKKHNVLLKSVIDVKEPYYDEDQFFYSSKERGTEFVKIQNIDKTNPGFIAEGNKSIVNQYLETASKEFGSFEVRLLDKTKDKKEIIAYQKNQAIVRVENDATLEGFKNKIKVSFDLPNQQKTTQQEVVKTINKKRKIRC